jgi:hypothetical protein
MGRFTSAFVEYPQSRAFPCFRLSCIVPCPCQRPRLDFSRRKEKAGRRQSAVLGCDPRLRMNFAFGKQEVI